jgi:hypothetical protein
MRVVRVGQVAVALALVLTGCGGPAAPDDKPFLHTLGFDRPIAFTISLSGLVDDNGAVIEAPTAHAVSHLVATHHIGVTPMLRAPWISFDIPTATISGDIATLLVGTRVVTGRSDERSWKEGSTPYYAETVSYRIEPLPGWSSVFSPVAGSFRLVLRFDNASNAWMIVPAPTGTTFDLYDAGLIVPQFTAEGTGPLGEAVEHAREQAFATIADQVLADNQLAHTNVTFVLVSKRTGLAYYTNPAPLPSTSTITDARRYCAGISTPGYGPWRMPTAGDMRGMLVGAWGTLMTPSSVRFPDSPDRRVWGEIAAPPGLGLRVRFASDTFSEYGRPGLTDHWQGSSDNRFSPVMYVMQADGSFGTTNEFWGMTPDQIALGYEGEPGVRVVCVTEAGGDHATIDFHF